MASPPGQSLLSRSGSVCSEDSSMCCCDAGLLSSGLGPARSCGSNPFDDFRQLERWAPVPALSLAGDADEDAQGSLWNTDRDTSIADALLRRLLTGETGAGGRSAFVRRRLRMTGMGAPHLDHFLEPSLSPLYITDGAAAVSRIAGDGAAATGPPWQGSTMPTMAPAAHLHPPISAFVARGQAGRGASSRSKTCVTLALSVRAMHRVTSCSREHGSQVTGPVPLPPQDICKHPKLKPLRHPIPHLTLIPSELDE